MLFRRHKQSDLTLSPWIVWSLLRFDVGGKLVSAEEDRKLRRHNVDVKGNAGNVFNSSNGPTITLPPVSSSTTMESNFMDWCVNTLKVETILEIQTFQYPDYVAAMKDRVDIFCEDDGDAEQEEYDVDRSDRWLSVEDYPSVAVRGLAATRDISIGTTVLRIPHTALWTISNLWEDDPVLAPIFLSQHQYLHEPVADLVEEADDEEEWNVTAMEEIPLLVVALLYHIELGARSPHIPYLRLLQSTSTSQYLHMWTATELRTKTPVGARKVAKNIQADVRALYHTVVQPLIDGYPQVFGRPVDRPHYYALSEDDDHEDNLDSDHDRRLENEEWMFSLERFHWAFALVNSRHWYLTLPQTINQASKKNRNRRDVPLEDDIGVQENDERLESQQFSEQAAPPAAMPTDEWLDLQRKNHQGEKDELDKSKRTDPLLEENYHQDTRESWPSGESFLAPLADLLNFGPPCTRGVYNTTSQTFDIVATCNFTKGQEVTFWYADACQDVFLANYGFTVPMMVLPCKDERDRDHQYHDRALREELLLAWEELDRMDQQLDQALRVIDDCECDVHQSQPRPSLAVESAVKSAVIQANDAEGDGPSISSFQQALARTPSPPKRARTPSPPKKGPTHLSVEKELRQTEHEVQFQQARHAIRGSNNGNSGRRKRKKDVDGLQRGVPDNQRAKSRKSDL